MAKAKYMNLKTPVGTVAYCNIKGTGKARSKTQPDKMSYECVVTFPNKEALAPLIAQVEELWNSWKKETGAKGALTLGYGSKCVGIAEERVKDPSGAIDPETEEVAYISTGRWQVKAHTSTEINGAPRDVKVLDRKGADITAMYKAADWSIGKDTTGVMHFSAGANDVGDNHKITLYLNAFQIGKLVKYAGSIEADEIDGEDIDEGEVYASAIPDEDKPEV
jgi:hypothetical protein